MTNRISTVLAAVLLDGAQPLVDSRRRASRRPYGGRPQPVPHADSKRWGFTHFGVFVPRLPEPYRYVNTMTLIGATGTELFDNDGLAVEEDVRRTTTVLASTAYDDHYHYRRYDTLAECDLAADGSALRWGGDLEIDVELPRVVVRGRYPTFSVDLTLDVTDNVGYFTKSPVYDHLSLLAPYAGTISDGTGRTSVRGLGTFEYCRAMTPQNLFSSPIPPRLKVPADFFTYQVLQLDERTQVLLTEVQARGRSACLMAHVRTIDGAQQVYEDVVFDVAEWGPEQIDPWGRRMRVPRRMRWSVTDDGGDRVLALEGEIDAQWRFGHGRGYVSAYHYAGDYRGTAVEGSGYIEWVDLRRKGGRP